jgi:hypothetical protein
MMETKNQFNISIKQGQMFDTYSPINESSEGLREKINPEFLKSTELLSQKDILEKLSKHNEYLLWQMGKDLEGVVLIDRKKSLKEFKEKTREDLGRTKSSFFHSDKTSTNEDLYAAGNINNEFVGFGREEKGHRGGHSVEMGKMNR